MLEMPKAVVYLLRNAANREWKQPQRKNYVSVNKAERSWASDMEMQFGVFPAGFWSCFGSVFPQYDAFKW